MIRRTVLAALAALAFAACGKVGPPVAPEVRLPRAVTDLTASVSDIGIQLAWTNPTHRVDNSRLRELSIARVFRYVREKKVMPLQTAVAKTSYLIAKFLQECGVPQMALKGRLQSGAGAGNGRRHRDRDAAITRCSAPQRACDSD